MQFKEVQQISQKKSDFYHFDRTSTVQDEVSVATKCQPQWTASRVGRCSLLQYFSVFCILSRTLLNLTPTCCFFCQSRCRNDSEVSVCGGREAACPSGVATASLCFFFLSEDEFERLIGVSRESVYFNNNQWRVEFSRNCYKCGYRVTKGIFGGTNSQNIEDDCSKYGTADKECFDPHLHSFSNIGSVGLRKGR